MANILICDDDRDIVAALKIYLSSEDYRLFTASTGKQALDCLRENEIDLVLMDIMMPEMDGIAATVKLREEYNIPVILLTAKSESSDKVLGLSIGADDYVTKPFGMMELVSRIKAVLRRSGKVEDRIDMELSGVRMDIKKHEVTVDGKQIALTLKEFELLEKLMRNQGIVLTRDQLLTEIWGYDFDGETRTVDVHIRRLREKIEVNPSDPKYVYTKWGVGYYFRG